MEYKHWEVIAKKYSSLGVSARQLKNMYRKIATGAIKVTDPAMKDYLNILVKKGELLNFISFLEEASNFSYNVRVGEDKFDSLDDKYSYSKMEKYGFGDIPIKHGEINMYTFISLLKSEYRIFIELEERNREKTRLEEQQRYADEQNKLAQSRNEKYEKYLEAYKLWCSKDAYWHTSHIHMLPTPEKYGLTENDLVSLDYYSVEAKNARLTDYRCACDKFQRTNSFLKSMLNGKRTPIPEDYGLSSSEVNDLRDYGQLLNGGKPRR